MKKYRFKLMPLERHRKVIEDEKKVELSKSLTGLKKIEARLYEIDESEVRARRAYASLGEMGDKNALTSSQFFVIDSFIQGQKIRRVETKKALEAQNEVVRKHFGEYLKARQSLKVIETLHEKDFKNYRQMRMKHERKQIDDVYTMRDRLSKRHDDDEGESNG
jgi:flagellar export protein FliJ